MQLKYNTIACLLGSATAFLTQNLQAQELKAANKLPEIVVKDKALPAAKYEVTEAISATKIATALRNVPQIVSIVPSAVMRDQGAVSLQDSLQNVAGLSFSIGDGQRDQVAIRGFTAINDQFKDGIRDDAMYFRDLSNIERVEVLKGPGSVLYGRGSAGGLVNRVSKKPQATSLAELAATLSSKGQKRAEFDLGGATSSLQFRLTGAFEDSSNFRKQYFLERQALAPSIAFQLQPATTILLQADYLHDKRLADQGVPSYHGRPVAVARDTYFGAANGREIAYVQSDVHGANITLDHRFSPELSLHSVWHGYDFSLSRNYTGIGSIKEGVNPTVSISQTRRLRDERGSYLQNELSQQTQWGDSRHQILVGLELGQQNKDEQLWTRPNVANYDLFAPVLSTISALPASLIAANDNKNRVDIAALYLQDLISFNPNWKLMAGLRYDQLKQKRDDRSKRNLDLQRTDHTVAPRLGIIYQPSETISLYATHSESFQPIADGFVFRANSDQLKPTRTVNHEIGIKLDIGGTSSLTAAIFDMSQNNIQVADPLNKNYALPIGKQGTRGMELSFSGEIAPQWDIVSGYAYMDGKILASTERTSANTPFQGNHSALTPKHSANLWLKHRFMESYYLAAGMRAESARFASADNLTVLPGYGVLNLGAGYTSKSLDVTLVLKNLLNRQYFISGHSGANDYNMPGEPRTLMVTTRYRF